jgi:hypothetical protein
VFGRNQGYAREHFDPGRDVLAELAIYAENNANQGGDKTIP